MLPLVVAAYVCMSLVAVALYAADKRRAARGAWRIRESTLHLVELLGGWPGALVAQHALRHKRRKRSYLVIFWLIVAAHAVAWVLVTQAA